jgi:hypothetical protein
MIYFSKKGMILYSWLSIQTYPKKMGEFENSSKSGAFWAIFFPPKNPFHTSK